MLVNPMDICMWFQCNFMWYTKSGLLVKGCVSQNYIKLIDTANYVKKQPIVTAVTGVPFHNTFDPQTLNWPLACMQHVYMYTCTHVHVSGHTAYNIGLV